MRARPGPGPHTAALTNPITPRSSPLTRNRKRSLFQNPKPLQGRSQNPIPEHRSPEPYTPQPSSLNSHPSTLHTSMHTINPNPVDRALCLSVLQPEPHTPSQTPEPLRRVPWISFRNKTGLVVYLKASNS